MKEFKFKDIEEYEALQDIKNEDLRELIESMLKGKVPDNLDEKIDNLKEIDQSLIPIIQDTFNEISHRLGLMSQLIANESYNNKSKGKPVTKNSNSHLMPIDKLSNLLRLEKIGYNRPYPVRLEHRGRYQEVTSSILLTREDLEELGILPANINDDDIRTLSALMTFYTEGADRVTLNQIYRKKVRNNKANPNKRQQAKLKEQLTKLNKTYIQIECSEEKKIYKYKDLLTEYEGHMISMDILTGYIKGNKTTQVYIYNISPLFQYALDKGQYLKVPYAASDNTLSRTEKTLRLEDYLYKRISQMRNKHNKVKNNIILVDTIAKNMNFNYKSKSAEENAISKLNKDTEEVLKGYVRHGFIKDYTPIGEGRRLCAKWEIIL